MDSLQVSIASILKCPLCHCAPVMPGSHFTTSSILAMDTPMLTTSLELPGRTRASKNMGMLGCMKIVILVACCVCLFSNCNYSFFSWLVCFAFVCSLLLCFHFFVCPYGLKEKKKVVCRRPPSVPF